MYQVGCKPAAYCTHAEFESQALHSPIGRGVLIMQQVRRLKRKPSPQLIRGRGLAVDSSGLLTRRSNPNAGSNPADPTGVLECVAQG